MYKINIHLLKTIIYKQLSVSRNVHRIFTFKGDNVSVEI